MMSSNDVIVGIKGLHKNFMVRKGLKVKSHVALQDINLEIRKGQFFGIIGRNGSGKSTLLRTMMKAVKPDLGKVIVNGTAIKLIPGMGFNPNLTARENVKLNSVLMGKTIKEANLSIDEIIEFAELEDVQEDKIKTYSSGMRARLAFSSAIHVEPDLLIMDEFFGGGGDERFKDKATKAFEDILLKGKTIIHASHNMGTVEKYCDEVLVLNKGTQIYCGEPKEAVRCYRSLAQTR